MEKSPSLSNEAAKNPQCLHQQHIEDWES